MRPKTLLWLGGPFLGAPGGPVLALMTFMVRPFAAAGYSGWIVAQRPNMAVGYTVADIAEDYAQVIAGEFGGKVDLVIGESTGGMIGFCLEPGIGLGNPRTPGTVQAVEKGHPRSWLRQRSR